MKKQSIITQEQLLCITEKLSTALENQNFFLQKIENYKTKDAFTNKLISKCQSATTFEEAAKTIAKELATLTSFNEGYLRLLDKKNNIFLEPKGYYCQNKTHQKPDKVYSENISENIFNKIFKNNKALMIENTKEFTGSNDLKNFLEEMEIRSNLIIPFYYQNKPLGAVILSDKQKNINIEADTLNFINYLIPFISSSLSSFYLQEKFQRTFNIEQTIQRILDKLKDIKNSEDLCDYILSELLDSFNVDIATRYSIEEETSTIKLTHIKSKRPIKKESIEAYDYTKAENKLLEEEILIINDADKAWPKGYTRNYLKKLNIKSYLVYPNILNPKLYAKYKNFGCIAIFKNKTSYWSSEDVYLFKMITDSLNIAFSESNRRNEVEIFKQNFIATLTHDLKSPLIAVEKLLESILEKDDNLHLKELRPELEEIIKTNKDLVNMIGNLLSLYHCENTIYSIKPEIFCLDELVQEIINILKYLTKDKNIEISTNISTPCPNIEADRQEIKRVISNLLANAIKYTRINGKIKIDIKRIESYILFCIIDQGPGVSEEEKKEIFNPYKSKKSKLGRGLGLYIAKQIIDAHNGNIWVESKESQGSTFCFTLPIKQNIPSE